MLDADERGWAITATRPMSTYRAPDHLVHPLVSLVMGPEAEQATRDEGSARRGGWRWSVLRQTVDAGREPRREARGHEDGPLGLEHPDFAERPSQVLVVEHPDERQSGDSRLQIGQGPREAGDQPVGRHVVPPHGDTHRDAFFRGPGTVYADVAQHHGVAGTRGLLQERQFVTDWIRKHRLEDEALPNAQKFLAKRRGDAHRGLVPQLHLARDDVGVHQPKPRRPQVREVERGLSGPVRTGQRDDERALVERRCHVRPDRRGSNPSPDKIIIATSRGLKKEYYRVGTLAFAVEGTQQKLTVLSMSVSPKAGDELFVPFRDATTGTETYDVGRYLMFPFQAGRDYVLDFNTATNPLCNYSPHYNCPIPPRDNVLTAAIRAGEMTYPKPH